MTTKSMLRGDTDIRWLDRAQSLGPVDNGWRVLGTAATTDYLADTDNWQMTDFNELCALEPALLAIWSLPVGTRLMLLTTSTGAKVFLDETSGALITADDIY